MGNLGFFTRDRDGSDTERVGSDMDGSFAFPISSSK